MFERLKKGWKRVRHGEPGERFQQRYHAKQMSPRGPVRKVAVITAGIVVVALGIFFIPAPGPGFLIVIIGAGMIAEESLPVARALDRIELKLRAAYHGLARRWRSRRR